MRRLGRTAKAGALALAFGAAVAAPAVVPPAAAQLAAVELTPARVEALIASFPAVKALAESLRTRFGVPDGGGNVGNAFGAFLSYRGALGDLNATVAAYGFGGFVEWVQVLGSAATALAFAEDGGGADAQIAEAIAAIRANTNIPAAQRDMMIQMIQSQTGAINAMRPSPGNLAAVQPYAAQLRAVLNN